MEQIYRIFATSSGTAAGFCLFGVLIVVAAPLRLTFGDFDPANCSPFENKTWKDCKLKLIKQLTLDYNYDFTYFSRNQQDQLSTGRTLFSPEHVHRMHNFRVLRGACFVLDAKFVSASRSTVFFYTKVTTPCRAEMNNF